MDPSHAHCSRYTTPCDFDERLVLEITPVFEFQLQPPPLAGTEPVPSTLSCSGSSELLAKPLIVREHPSVRRLPHGVNM